MFKELFTEASRFKTQDLIRILVDNGYRTYKNKTPNRMHEFHNKKKIVSIASDEDGVATIFRIRDYDIKNGKTLEFKTIKDFEKIIGEK